MPSNDADDRLTPTQMVGLLCWRGGLMLVASYSFFRGARLVLENLDLPTQLEVGFGLALAGVAMVMLSLVVERMQDAKEEDFRE